MYSIGHDLNRRDQVLNRQDVNSDDVSQDDHVRSWLDATDASAEHEEHNLGQGEPPSNLNTTEGETSGLVRGEDPPPYTIHDPAKDQHSTHEFELDENNSANAELYVPFYLRTWMFIAFTFTFAAMLIAVEVMFQISNQHQGLSTQDASRHYLWTYGPTLFLSIVAAFWGQVEYRVKQLMPWKVMTKGPVPAEKVLLLDYVSSWNVPTLFWGAKAKHIAVSLAIAGSLLIKLAIIFSTGLLSLESRMMFNEGVEMQLADTFNGFSGLSDDAFLQPVITVVGASQYGLDYPPGTSETFAVQSFQPVRNITDVSSIMGAPVDVFSADLSCEMATVSKVSDGQCDTASSTHACETLRYNLTVSSHTCTTNTSQVQSTIHRLSNQYYGSVTAGTCIGEPSNTDILRYTFVSGQQIIDYNHGAANATRSTAMICRPVYQVCRVPVGLFLNGTIHLVAASNSSCSSITYLTGWDVGESVMSSIEAAASSTLVDLSIPEDVTSQANAQFDTFFAAMYTTNQGSSFSDFTDSTYLETSVRHLFSTVAAQVAKSHFMLPSTQQINGIVIANEQRLFVREVPLRLLESIFAALIAIALVTLLKRPSSSTPCDVSTLAGVATVLANSPRTCTAFQGLGAGSGSDLKETLAGKTCSTVINTESEQPVFRLITTCGGGSAVENVSLNDDVRWWQPFSMTIAARVGFVLLPLAVIASLEAVYQHSKQGHGLVDVDETSSYRYVWTYIPALVMTAIHTGFGMIDFNTRIFQPYEVMRKDPSIADRSININYLAHVTPVSVWKAISRKHYAVAVTGVAMILAPTLTIVVSGLYIPSAVEAYTSTQISLKDSINNTVAWDSSTSMNLTQNANTISTLITEANLSFPDSTYDGYVLPRIDTAGFLLDQFGSNVTANTTSVRVEMPAYYAALNCTWAEPTVTLPQKVSQLGSITVPVPLGCGDVCANSDASASIPCDTSNSSIFDMVGKLSLANGTSAYGITYIPSGAGKEIPQNCPQLALVYGQGTVNASTSTAELDLGAALCSPVVYQVMVNTTYTMPGFSILSLEVDVSKKVVVEVGSNATLALYAYLPPTNWGVDGFFGGLVPGRDGTTWTQLIGEANFPHFSEHVDNLYSIIYTQWLNLNGRAPVPTTADEPLHAVVMNPTRMRLIQSAISTRILEGLLAAMTICIVLALFLLDTRRLLPLNPCSIGATAALLSESELLKSIPEGAEWYDGKELRRKRVFSDFLFSLGWWDGLGGTKRFGVDAGSSERERERADDR